MKQIDYKSVKLDSRLKDPVRFPKVINGFEQKSMRDFRESLNLEFEHIKIEINKIFK